MSTGVFRRPFFRPPPPPQAGLETLTNLAGEQFANLTQSIGDITLASDVDVVLGANLSASIGDITLSGTASVVSTRYALLLSLTSEAGVSGVSADLTQSIGAITLASAVVLPIQATLSASIGEVTLTSDVDVLVGAALSASIGEVTLSTAAVLPIGATLTAAVGEITLASDVAITTSGLGADLTRSIGDITLASDVNVSSVAGSTASDPGGGGGKRYWDWIKGRKMLASRVRKEDVDAIQRALAKSAAKKGLKRPPTVLRMGQAIRAKADAIPYEVKSELAVLGVLSTEDDNNQWLNAAKRERDLISATYLALLEEQEQQERDEEEVVIAFLDYRRWVQRNALIVLKAVA